MTRREELPSSTGEPDDVELVVEVVHEHPADGVYEDGYRPSQAPRRRGPQAAGALVVLIALIGIVYVIATAKPSAEQGGRRTPGTRALTVPPVEFDAVRPTMVAPTRLPADLQLVEGASDRTPYRDGRPSVIVWSAAQRQALEVVAQPGCRNRSHALADRAVAVAQARRDPGSGIRWCEGGLELTVYAGPSTDSEVAADVVASVEFDAAVGDDEPRLRSVAVPTGFEEIRDAPHRERVLLRYAARSKESSVVVLVEGGDRSSLDRYSAQALLNGGWRAQRTQIGPSEGFVVEQASGTAIYLQYDDHTVVSITGEGVSGDEVRDVAASLGGADPAIAPTVCTDVLTRLANRS